MLQSFKSFGFHVKRVAFRGGRVLGTKVSALVLSLFAVGAVGSSMAREASAVVTWPTGLEPNTIVPIFTDYIYDAIPIIVGVLAVLTGVWYVIWSIHSFVTRKG